VSTEPAAPSRGRLRRPESRHPLAAPCTLADGVPAHAPPPPPSRTKWTRLVHPSVLTGHVSSLADGVPAHGWSARTSLGGGHARLERGLSGRALPLEVLCRQLRAHVAPYLVELQRELLWPVERHQRLLRLAALPCPARRPQRRGRRVTLFYPLRHDLRPAPARASAATPPPPSRTKWTRLVHPSVLTGHVSSLSP
jgi:hypothetical protein